jgi:hypothetical protein
METPAEVIDKVVHRQIIAEMARVCEVANVPEQYVRRSMRGVCKDVEVEWVRSFNIRRAEGLAGLVVEGTVDTQKRCMAITGTLVRNFVDARIMSVNSVVDDQVGAGTPTVLVIPNLYIKTKDTKAALSPWQVQKLYDVLLTRFASNKPTVVCIENMPGLRTDYGAAFAEHLQENFVISA